MPMPSRNAARFVVHTPRCAIIRMSTKGLRLANSWRTHPATSSTPMPSSPKVRGELRPQALASLTATRREVRPATISATDPRSTGARVRTGERRHPVERGDADGYQYGQRQPEQPAPTQRAAHRAGDHESQAGADAQQRRHQADRTGHPIGVEFVP